jgi:hypothetical protein
MHKIPTMFTLSTTFFTFISLVLVAAAPARCPVRNNAHSTNSPSAQSTNSPSTAAATTAYSALFPVQNIVKSWSTANIVPNALPLADATFHPTDLLSGLSNTYTSAPDGKQSLRARYPEGSYTFEHSPLGGFSFYAPGPNSIDLTTAKEATLAYSVLFQDGFEFNLGGKLPGLCTSLIFFASHFDSSFNRYLPYLQTAATPNLGHVPALADVVPIPASPRGLCGDPKVQESFTRISPLPSKQTQKCATSHPCLPAIPPTALPSVVDLSSLPQGCALQSPSVCV